MYIIIAAIIIAIAIIIAAFIIENRLIETNKILDMIDFRIVNISYNSNNIVGMLGEFCKKYNNIFDSMQK